GDLRVDEHVLDLLRPPGEPVAGAPGPYLKAWELRGNPPPSPQHLPVEGDGGPFQPDLVVFAHRGDAAAEVEPPRAGRRRKECLRRRGPLLCGAEEVLARGRVEAFQAREDLLADEPALRVPVARVDAELEPLRAAVGLGLLAPDREQRPDDAVLAVRLDPT